MTTLHDFEAYLSDRQLVQKKQLPYFIRWASNYLSFCEKSGVFPYHVEANSSSPNFMR